MQRRSIPGTSLQVSTLCLGTMTFGTPVGETEAVRLTHEALALGIDFIDTADMYEGYSRFIGSPGGVAEEILGKALYGKRDAVVLATKVGMKVGPGDDEQGLGRAHMLREIDASLRRLRTDHVDLYYAHKPDPAVPHAESAAVFNELVQAGKARHWAVSNYTAAELAELLRVCDEEGLRRPVAIQPAYSLLERGAEADLLPLCVREGIAVVPYRVLEGGVLTGKYRRGADLPAGSRQTEKPEWTLPLDDDLFDRLEALEAEALAAGRTLPEHALRALLERPQVVSLVVGAKRPDQLEALVRAVD